MVNSVTSANQKIKTVLITMLDEYSLGSQSSRVLSLHADPFLNDAGVDRFTFLKILENLRERNIIKSFLIRKGSKVRYESDDKQDFDTCGISIPIDFKKLVEDYIYELSKKEIKQEHELGSILYLDSTGNLWHGDKEKFCYSMKETKGRLSIVKYLAENKGYQQTADIASFLEGKTTQNIRTEITKIRTKINHYLYIDNLIENKIGSGYRINPKYQIKITK